MLDLLTGFGLVSVQLQHPLITILEVPDLKMELDVLLININNESTKLINFLKNFFNSDSKCYQSHARQLTLTTGRPPRRIPMTDDELGKQRYPKDAPENDIEPEITKDSSATTFVSHYQDFLHDVKHNVSV